MLQTTMSDKKSKYLTKRVSFGGKEVTLYSIDGLTWSTRRSELAVIKERQEKEKVSFAQLKEDEAQDDKGEDQGDEDESAAKAAPVKEERNRELIGISYEDVERTVRPEVEDFLGAIPMLKASFPKRRERPEREKAPKKQKVSKKQKVAPPAADKKKGSAAAPAGKKKNAADKNKGARKAAAKVKKPKKQTAKSSKPSKAKAAKVAPKQRASSKKKAKGGSKSKRKVA